MALDPLELIIIGVVAVVIFLWGPQKIPELARALGRARREFDQASREISTGLSAENMPLKSGESMPLKSGDQLLLETAQRLGISTAGKTREQISDEIVKKSGK